MSNKILNTTVEKFTRMMFSRVIERLAVVISEEHLSFSQVAAIHIIDREKSISIHDIATRLNLSLSATSRLINDLVKTDFVDRQADQENRRTKILTLTSHGKNFLDHMSIERVKIIKNTAKNIPSTDTASGNFLNAMGIIKMK